MIRALRLLLLVFTTLGTLFVGAIWAVPYLPNSWECMIERPSYRIFARPRYDVLHIALLGTSQQSNAWLNESYGRVEFCVMISRIRNSIPITGKIQWRGYGVSAFGVENCSVGRPLTHQERLVSYRSYPHSVGYSICLPTWLWFIGISAYPAFVALRRIRQHWRSRREECCRECGYDLTGNESGVCPECGKPIPILASESRP